MPPLICRPRTQLISASPLVTQQALDRIRRCSPLPLHASTHAAGGTDPLTVDSGSAAIGVTDPGHLHLLSTVTPAIATILVGMSDSLHNINADDRVMGTIDQSAAAAAPVSQTAHIRNMNVVFPAAWAGGDVTVVGIDTLGLPISETHTKPAGGGTSLGVKPFQFATGYTNSAPGGAPGTVASITNGVLVGVSHYPVAGFTKASYDGAQRDFTTTDPVWGMFDIVGGHTGNHNIEVWFTVDISPSQAAHSHAVTPNATGIAVVDTGHTHALSS